MMKSRLAAFALTLTLAVPALAHADETSKRATAEKLVVAMHVDKTVDDLMNVMKQQVLAIELNGKQMQSMNAQQKHLYAEMQDKITDTVKTDLLAAMKPQLVDLYMKSYTEDEIEGMYNFFSSPVGQSVLAKMPQTMQTQMQAMQSTITKEMETIQPIVADYQQRIKNAGSDK